MPSPVAWGTTRSVQQHATAAGAVSSRAIYHESVITTNHNDAQFISDQQINPKQLCLDAMPIYVNLKQRNVCPITISSDYWLGQTAGRSSHVASYKPTQQKRMSPSGSAACKYRRAGCCATDNNGRVQDTVRPCLLGTCTLSTVCT